MILDCSSAIGYKFERGAVYTLKVGSLDFFQKEVSIIWDYLRQSSDFPVQITLIPIVQEHWGLPDDVQPELQAEDHCSESLIILHTSGTTGVPKKVVISVAENFRRKRIGVSQERWLLTYAPYRWAGLSVLLHVLKADATLIVPKCLDPQSIVDSARQNRATHTSMTPSFLRKLQLSISSSALAALELQQVTFGGEAASQHIIDNANNLWPRARISHVYASTEFGDICSISDKLAGIPSRKFHLERFQFLPSGELIIDGKETGDLWKEENDRFYFIGRKEEMINVGGAKVSPLEVEEVALSLDGVDNVKAYAVKSPLLGEVVGLDYCGTIERSVLIQGLRTRLPKVACPLVLRQVSFIELSPAGKKIRVLNK